MHFWKQWEEEEKMLTKLHWMNKKEHNELKRKEFKKSEKNQLFVMASPNAFIFPLERNAKVLLWKPNTYFYITQIMKPDTKVNKEKMIV